MYANIQVQKPRSTLFCALLSLTQRGSDVTDADESVSMVTSPAAAAEASIRIDAFSVSTASTVAS